MECKNRIKNIINIFLPLFFAFLIQNVVILIDLVMIFIKNIFSDEKTVARKTMSAIILEDYNQPMNKAFLLFLQFTIFIIVFGIWYLNYINHSRWQIKNIKPSIKEGFFKICIPPIIIFFIIGGIAGQFFVDSILMLVRPLFEKAFSNYDNLVSNVTGASVSWLMLLDVFLLAPIAEELLFRGLIFNYAKKSMPVVFALLLQGLLFGLYHGNLIQGTYAFLLGILLGIIVLKTKTVISSIIFHISLNLSILFVSEKCFNNVLNSTIICIISGIILFLCIFLFIRVLKSKERKITD